MELKVWVEGIQRIVCGVTEKTTCQDVVYALAHATGKTGRFTLIERWRNNERLLAPQEHPLKVLNKWGEYSQDVQFILQRSALDGMKNNASAAPTGGQLMSPQLQRSNFGGVPGPPVPPGSQPNQVRGTGVMTKSQSAEPPAVWKPPPPHGAISGIPGSSVIQSSTASIAGVRGVPNNNNPPHHPSASGGPPMHRNNKAQNNGLSGQPNHYQNDISSENVPNGVPPIVGSSRLSPDSGRGSDKTGSDTSNSYSDKDNHQRTIATNASVSNTISKNSNVKLAQASNTGQNLQAPNKASPPSQNPSYHTANGLPPSSYGLIQRSASATQMAWNRSGTPNNPNMYAYDNNQQAYQSNNMPNGVASNNINQNHLTSESPYGFAKQASMPALNHPSQQYLPPNSSTQYQAASSSQQMMHPPAYRPPPGPQQQQYLQQTSASYMNRNSSPADPPPYRDPPPPPGVRFRPPMPSSPTNMPGAPLMNHQQQPYRPQQYQGHQPYPGGNGQYATQPVRPPHYSPPPTHRVAHLSRHPSKSSLMGAGNLPEGASGGSRNRQLNQDQRLNQYQTRSHSGQQSGNGIAAIKNKQKGHHLQQHPPVSQSSLTDMNELLNLVTAQQSTLQSQQADIRQYETEEQGFDGHISTSNPGMVPRTSSDQINGPDGGSVNDHNGLLSPGSQLDLVLSEVRRLEEMSNRNDEELKFLNSERAQMDNQMMAQQQNTISSGSNNSSPLDPNDSPVDENIRGEILQLKHRLAGTDIELQRTNTTLRRLGDEMRNMSLEKSRQREQELGVEIERLQAEIKSLQKSSEDSANISQQLSKDVKDVEDQIRARKSEVEQLIKEMREANMESLAISPPEESKQFLDGPPKPGSSRKMMGSPRQLENAVPTSRNPHGVWV